MLTLENHVCENVGFQSSRYTFDELCEKAYLSGVIEHLRQLMGDSFYEYGFIIYSGSDALGIDLNGADPSKTVVFHISDESSSVPYELCSKVRAVFKSYLPRERIVPNLYSLPLGYVGSTPDLDPLPINERQQNVFFSGNLNAKRVLLFKTLATPKVSPVLFPWHVLSVLNSSMRCDGFLPHSYIRFTNGFRRGLAPDDYARHLVNSKIVLCPSGDLSQETFRHFEAMRAGAIIVSEELPPLDCYRGSPIIFVNNWRGLRNLITNLLATQEELLERQAKMLAWWKTVCCESATATRIARIISK